MDKKDSRRIITKKARVAETPINEKFVYVRDEDQYLVDIEEFDLISDFLKFLRERKRGVFTVEIITGGGKRVALRDNIDKKKYELKLLD